MCVDPRGGLNFIKCPCLSQEGPLKEIALHTWVLQLPCWYSCVNSQPHNFCQLKASSTKKAQHTRQTTAYSSGILV